MISVSVRCVQDALGTTVVLDVTAIEDPQAGVGVFSHIYITPEQFRELWHRGGEILQLIDQGNQPAEPGGGSTHSQGPSPSADPQMDIVEETSTGTTPAEGGDVPPSVPELREGPH